MARKPTGRRPRADARRPAAARPPAGAASRRRGLLAAGLFVVAAGLAGWWWSRGPAFALTSSPDQNVLLVTIDTLREDALSVYGGPAATPNLDRLASHGARFTFAHSHAVVTLPSHTSILTGEYPYQHGMRDNSGFRVRPGTATIATRLKALGFATGAFIGGFPVSKRFGLTPGFDAYDDQLPEVKGEVSFAMPERRAEVVVGRALDWIGKQQGKFFAWVHVFDPHSPYRPPPEYMAQYQAQPYYGEVAYVDHALGPLFDRLTTLPRRTVVIVTADHGESLGDHGEETHGMFAYESTLHVPLIVAEIDPHASSQPRGVVIGSPVRHIDIAPTVLDVVEAKPDSTLPGTSLAPLIRTGSGPDRPSYFEAMTYNLVRGWAPLRGVLVAKDKYIDLPIPELYDLITDPKETRNLVDTERDQAALMLSTLKTYNMAPPDRPGMESAEVTASLRTLGYVTGTAAAKAIYTDKDDPKVLLKVDQDLHHATDLYQTGRVQEAVALLTQVLQEHPDTADAALQLAYAYWEAGQPEPAIRTLETALAKGAPDRDVRIRLGIYLAESHTDSARAIRLLEGLPDTDVEGLNGLGIAYSDARRYEDAIKTFDRVLKLDSTNGLAYQNLAYVHLRQVDDPRYAADRQKNAREAETLIRQAIQADPSLAGAYTMLGVILNNSGRKPEAIDAWKHAVELDSSDFNALYNLWLELARAGRRDEAIDYGRQFVASAPPAFYQSSIDEIRRYLGG